MLRENMERRRVAWERELGGRFLAKNPGVQLREPGQPLPGQIQLLLGKIALLLGLIAL